MDAVRFLRIKEPGGAPRMVRLAAEPVVLGRDEGCTVQLESPFVSRRHARIEAGPDGAVLADLGSHNGCLVNGRRIAGKLLLRHGDVIGIGDVTVECLADARRTLKTRTLVRPLIRDTRALGPAAGQTQTHAPEELEAPEAPPVPTEHLSLDSRTMQVWIDACPLPRRLSTQEFTLLSYLYEHRDRVCSRRELGNAIWERHTWDPNLLYRLIRRLKEKVEPDPKRPRFVQTVPWVGYRLTP
jgi:pSer/pThr/pTyr-binding forkhead associated (FHA) protein